MILTKPRPKRNGLRRAAAAVEFALVAPFLFVLATGTFEMARGIMVRQVLTDAVRKACRNGVLPAHANSNITQDVNDVLSDNAVPTSAATITILVNGVAVDASTAVANDQISVKVSVPFNKVAWTPLFFFTNTSVESETLTMMRQG
jgi:Flp pilus assembly protein TadG